MRAQKKRKKKKKKQKGAKGSKKDDEEDAYAPLGTPLGENGAVPWYGPGVVRLFTQAPPWSGDYAPVMRRIAAALRTLARKKKKDGAPRAPDPLLLAAQ